MSAIFSQFLATLSLISLQTYSTLSMGIFKRRISFNRVSVESMLSFIIKNMLQSRMSFN
jgi:hypothetical protein